MPATLDLDFRGMTEEEARAAFAAWEAALPKLKEWDPDLHPRGEGGLFTESGGGTNTADIVMIVEGTSKSVREMVAKAVRRAKDYIRPDDKPIIVDTMNMKFNPNDLGVTQSNGLVSHITLNSMVFDSSRVDPVAMQARLGTCRWLSTGEPDQVIIHELGHALQGRSVIERDDQNNWTFLYGKEDSYIGERIAARVSTYAMRSPIEFVAETFAGLVHGKKYDADVMQVYRKLGGREKVTKRKAWVEKFNENHDELGRFASSDEASPVEPKAYREGDMFAENVQFGAKGSGFLIDKMMDYDAGGLKEEVDRTIGKILSTDPRVIGEIVPGRDTAEELGYNVARMFVDGWAGSASDSNENSLALQEAIREKFGVAGNPGYQALVDTVATGRYWDDTMQLARAFVDATYQITQDKLKELGITSIELHRGMVFNEVTPLTDADLVENIDRVVDHSQSYSLSDGTVIKVEYDHATFRGVAELELNPVSSFTLNNYVAKEFAGIAGDTGLPDKENKVSVLLHTRVPASQIFSIPLTGPGCKGEQEVLVIGKPTPAYVEAGYRERVGSK